MIDPKQVAAAQDALDRFDQAAAEFEATDANRKARYEAEDRETAQRRAAEDAAFQSGREHAAAERVKIAAALELAKNPPDELNDLRKEVADMEARLAAQRAAVAQQAAPSKGAA